MRSKYCLIICLLVFAILADATAEVNYEIKNNK